MNQQEIFLLKLGEVVLKGLNRRSFEDKLLSNVRRRLREVYRLGSPSLRQGAVCKRDSQQLADMPVAMAYVPWQEWYGIFDLEKALCCGTIFEELNKPFTGAGGRR